MLVSWSGGKASEEAAREDEQELRLARHHWWTAPMTPKKVGGIVAALMVLQRTYDAHPAAGDPDLLLTSDGEIQTKFNLCEGGGDGDTFGFLNGSAVYFFPGRPGRGKYLTRQEAIDLLSDMLDKVAASDDKRRKTGLGDDFWDQLEEAGKQIGQQPPEVHP